MISHVESVGLVWEGPNCDLGPLLASLGKCVLVRQRERERVGSSPLFTCLGSHRLLCGAGRLPHKVATNFVFCCNRPGFTRIHLHNYI